MTEFSVNLDDIQSSDIEQNDSVACAEEPSTRGTQVDEVTTREGWLALEREWDQLLEKSDVTVFQSFEWLSTWWDYFHNGGRLWVLTIREEGTLIGVLPLYVQVISVLGVVTSRRVQFIGHGLSDYLMPIVVRGREVELSQLFLSFLLDRADRWDVVDFEDINEDFAFTKWLLEKDRPGLPPVIVRVGLICPRKRLLGDWGELLHSLGPNGRSNYKRKLKRLTCEFGGELDQIREPGPRVESAVDTFVQIHGGRWKAIGYPSAFDNRHHRDFHVDVSQRLARKGWLWMFVLKAQGIPVAVCYTFSFRKTLYMYQCNAHGHAEVMKASPGFVVQGLAMERGICEGFSLFDFLRGDESYKLDEWKGDPSQNYFVRVLSPSVISQIRRKAFLYPKEFFQKGCTRLQHELCEYRRFVLTKTPSRGEKTKFILNKLTDLVRLVKDYVVRHT